VLLAAIEEFFDKNGYYTASVQQIKNYLLSVLDENEVPGVSSIAKIIKKTFHLKFASLNKANLKYRDPTYNEKRKWVSRLLSQFMKEDALIISIDESNFRSDSLPNR
jgi:hypothetical protein